MGTLLGWLHDISGNAIYLAVGLLVFAEDALLLGFVVPGETAAILGGALVAEGRVDLWLMMAVVSAAAVAGDSTGYWVGRRLGTRLLSARSGAKRRQRIEKAGDFVDRHGGIAIFLGRFVAFVRTVVPAIAGANRVRYRRFLAYNVPAGILWGAGNVLIGVLAAQSYERVASALGTGAAVLLGVAALTVFVVWRVRRGRA